MRNKIGFGLLLLTLCLILAWSLSRLEDRPQALREGDAIPDLLFLDSARQQHSFSTLRGKVLVINFWATWCPPCREEMPSLNALFRQMQGKPVEFLTFSVDDSWEAVRQFLKQGNYVLPVYADFDRRLANQFGTLKFPETYLVDRKGIVRMKVIGAANWTASQMVSFLASLAAE